LLALACSLLFFAPLFLGIPFIFYAITWYSRVEIESGIGIRRFKVYRAIGTHRTLDIPWESIRRILTVALVETRKGQDSEGGERWSRYVAWQLTIEKTDGESVVLTKCEPKEQLDHFHAKAAEGEFGQEEAVSAHAKEQRLLDEILAIIRPYFKDKWTFGAVADGEELPRT